VKYLRKDKVIVLVGLKIKSLRLQHQKTQEQVAFEAGIEPMQLSKIERGIINTSISQIFAIATAIGIHPKEIFDIDFDHET
jgi:transcriptional regulator with XRE-family HTH domain